MCVRRPWLVVVVLLIAPAAHADDHRADFFGAFSAAKGSTLLGGHVTLGLTSAWAGTRLLSQLYLVRGPK